MRPDRDWGCRVVVVDKMGLLSSLYRYGQVAYIGGGFGAGIHNTIEAAVYGMPVVFGPKYRHFREAKALINAGAGFSVKNYRQLETWAGKPACTSNPNSAPRTRYTANCSADPIHET